MSSNQYRKYASVVVPILILLTAACGQQSSTSRALALADSLHIAVKSLEQKIEDLDFQIWREERARKNAMLKPTDNGYDTITMDFGTISVSLEDITPYANGSRVTLKFGNATSATINDITTLVWWGPVDENGDPINSKSHSRRMSLDKSLPAGRWTTLTLTLEAVPPDQLGFVSLSGFQNSGIGLLRQ